METIVGITKVIAAIFAVMLVYYAFLGWKHRKSHAMDDIQDFSFDRAELDDESFQTNNNKTFYRNQASFNKNIAMSNLLQTIRAIAVETSYSIPPSDLEELAKGLDEYRNWSAKCEQEHDKHSSA